jgi:hypothetical protein
MLATLGHEFIEDTVEFPVALLAGIGDTVGQGIALRQDIAVLPVQGLIPHAVVRNPLHSIRHDAFPVLESQYSKT